MSVDPLLVVAGIGIAVLCVAGAWVIIQLSRIHRQPTTPSAEPVDIAPMIQRLSMAPGDLLVVSSRFALSVGAIQRIAASVKAQAGDVRVLVLDEGMQLSCVLGAEGAKVHSELTTSSED